MRHATVAMLSAVGVFSMMTSVSVARSDRKTVRCASGNSHVVMADAKAQVYMAYPAHGYFLKIYGCAYGSHLTYLLGEEARFSSVGGGGIEHVELDGTVVAYEESQVVPCCRKTELIIIRDLRTGRVLHRVPTGIPAMPISGYIGNGPVVSIVVKSDGAVAWMVEAEGEPSPEYYQVYAVDKFGSRLLASGTDVSRSSLALAGSTLYWTQGGHAFSVLLR